MKDFEFALKGFRFPRKLSNNKANFRFVVDLRFINGDDQFITEHAVMPSLDTFWECDTSRQDNPNYVRSGDTENENIEFEGKNYDCSMFNIGSIDAWDRLILRVKGKRVHSIQFKVFDVDRKDAWDEVKNFLGGVIRTVIGGIKGGILGKAPFPLPAALGGAADDVQSFLLKKLAGGDDVLFRGSTSFEDENGYVLQDKAEHVGDVRGRGTEGFYWVTFQVKIV